MGGGGNGGPHYEWDGTHWVGFTFTGRRQYLLVQNLHHSPQGQTKCNQLPWRIVVFCLLVIFFGCLHYEIIAYVIIDYIYHCSR